MKFRHRKDGESKIELQMTPMIDIVFQLLTFFIMSFKITSQEGDFNIRMPLAAPSASSADDSLLPPLRLKLMADSKGLLRKDGIVLNDQVFPGFDALHSHIRGLLGDASGPGSADKAEVEIDCDYQLKYASAVAAVTAVSGYIDQDGNIVKLIDNINFTPPKQPAQDGAP